MPRGNIFCYKNSQSEMAVLARESSSSFQGWPHMCATMPPLDFNNAFNHNSKGPQEGQHGGISVAGAQAQNALNIEGSIGP